MNGTSILPISQLRQHAADVIANVVSKQQPAIILQRSKPKVVIVDLTYFQALEDAALDNGDFREIERAKKEKRFPITTYLQKRWGKSAL